MGVAALVRVAAAPTAREGLMALGVVTAVVNATVPS